ncbi:hypothetical protein PCANC_15070 [Puccinia coronata f. sp. avenae]|uniref:Uncharacterized protein n=1 Tax=Puccinia coronata f. sp. avenae TaxID=200324 RepID=A0A2N5TLK4_9BASI|nr:hypothetical protein PCASD_19657 [Puccinia coronata f. sp. avenae]PLW34720.1 hypothetical protein PCANC_15070 [Puccinia coronata f. sp. avenae]
MRVSRGGRTVCVLKTLSHESVFRTLSHKSVFRTLCKLSSRHFTKRCVLRTAPQSCPEDTSVPKTLRKRLWERLRTNVSSGQSNGVLRTLSLGKRPEDGGDF